MTDYQNTPRNDQDRYHYDNIAAATERGAKGRVEEPSFTQDMDSVDLLQHIYKELVKMNMYLSIMTNIHLDEID